MKPETAKAGNPLPGFLRLQAEEEVKGVLTVATILLFTVLRTDLILTTAESYSLLAAYLVFLGWVVGETVGVFGLVRV